jgi:hypothetical protein
MLVRRVTASDTCVTYELTCGLRSPICVGHFYVLNSVAAVDMGSMEAVVD